MCPEPLGQGRITMTTTVSTQRIVVGIDGSETARQALRWAADEAALRSADLEVVLVWSYPYYVDPVGGVYPLPSMFDATEQRERGLLDEEIKTVLGEAPTINIVRTTRCGSTAPELLDAAKGADLLVLGSRGRGGFMSMLLGSTSMHCVQHSPCPVIVIPHSPEAS